MLVMESTDELLVALGEVSDAYRAAREQRLQAVADARGAGVSDTSIAAAAGVSRAAIYHLAKTIVKYGVVADVSVTGEDALARIESVYSEVADTLEERNRLLLAAYDAGVGPTRLGKVTGMTQAGTSSTIRGLRGAG